PNLASTNVKYKLADHRYGREEMLALFTHSDEAPDQLKEHPIYSADALVPLALLPQTEEEQ
ncbi:hypothetical protein HELRODRAFT_138134, partial [Helobdella robusta]|uniref:Uncharacterized protein n=1 Tax=Helobdella robusta TaxID=6412 RepID=T1EIS0_HELRO